MINKVRLFSYLCSRKKMKIEELLQLYALSPKVKALADLLGEKSEQTVFPEGLMASSVGMTFAALNAHSSTLLFIMNDADEAGYLYHDLQQLMGNRQVLFFPSSYRRSVKYGQRDAANEILRTEVLAVLNTQHPSPNTQQLNIVTYPEAVAELVVSKKKLDSRTLVLQKGQTIEPDQMTETLRSFGFREVDYVYEPGQFALRGSILDVFSFSSEYPFRIDFFGDDIDSIRTFEVENQLSRDKREQVEIVPELSGEVEDRESLLQFLPKSTVLVIKDLQYVHDIIDQTYNEGFSAQAVHERLADATEEEQAQVMAAMRKEVQLSTASQFAREAAMFRQIRLGAGASPSRGRMEGTALSFSISPQPLFHKNFELLKQTLTDYQLRGYHIYILADSQKQNERLKEILGAEGTSAVFTPVEKTLHEGFIDHDLKLCIFTDHQIFDRFHKYNLKSDRARSGKVALTLKEIQQFEVGDYIVHIDHGIGKFGGLVRMPQGDGYQEMIKIVYQGGGAI